MAGDDITKQELTHLRARVEQLETDLIDEKWNHAIAKQAYAKLGAMLNFLIRDYAESKLIADMFEKEYGPKEKNDD